MAVLSTDLKFYKTTNNLGGAITASESTGTDIFDAFTGDETTNGVAGEYACLYVKNESAQTALNARVHIDGETVHSGVNFTLGLGTSAVNGTEQTIANKDTAPAGVTFSEAQDLANALTIGDIPAGQHKAVWYRVTVTAGTLAKDNYQAPLKLTVDSGE